jgi:hypothetical protein
MNLSPRFIVIAVLVVASALSLGLAGRAQAYSLKEAQAECTSIGGSFETHFDSTSHQFIGTCTTLFCSIKPLQIGRITILYPSCTTRTWAMFAQPSVR